MTHSSLPDATSLSLLLSRELPTTVLECTESTNDEAKSLLLAGAESGSAVLAYQQKKGRGRLSRAFSSDTGGVYLSVAITSPLPENPAYLTFSAAVAAAEVIEETVRQPVGIKWVNDLLLSEKKCAGILTEGVFSPKTGLPVGAVVGIGVNYGNELPASLSESAVSLTSFGTPRLSYEAFAEKLLSFLRKALMTKDFFPLTEYRRRCRMDGRRVRVCDGVSSFFATVLGVEDDGSLSVRCEDGKTLLLRAGEVSLHGF